MKNKKISISEENLDVRLSARFMDGESCIGFYEGWHKNGRGKSYYTQWGQIQVCGTDFAPIKELQRVFKKYYDVGAVYPRKPRLTEKGKWTKPQLMFQVQGRKVAVICKAILPYLLTTQRIETSKKIIEYYNETK